MKVYLVMSGEYSDWCIEAIFTDKTQAELYCATHQELESCRVYEYAVDEHKLDASKKVKQIWEVLFRNDKLIYCSDRGYTFDDIFSVYREDYNIIVDMSLDTGIDKERAAKIACDKYAQWKYEQIENSNDNK